MLLLLSVHIVGAGLGLVAGAAALAAAKGSVLHRRAGVLFVYAMLTMSTSASVIAASKGQIGNLIGGLMTAYFVITAWTTVRPAFPGSRPLGIAMATVVLAFATANLLFGFAAIASASGRKFGLPPFPFLMFGAVGLTAGIGDIRAIRSGPLRGVPRLVRHLWRMCWAMWIATASFFAIRSRVAAVFGSSLATPAFRIAPIVLVLVVMLYWLWRIRFRRSLRGLQLFETVAPASARPAHEGDASRDVAAAQKNSYRLTNQRFVRASSGGRP